MLLEDGSGTTSNVELLVKQYYGATINTRCGGALAFRWAPFAENVADFVAGLNRDGVEMADALVTGVGLWDLLVRHDFDAYEANLARALAAVEALLRDKVACTRDRLCYAMTAAAMRRHSV